MIRLSFHLLLFVSILFTSLTGSVSALSELVAQDHSKFENAPSDHSNNSDDDANDLPEPIAELEDTDDEEEKRRLLLPELGSPVHISIFKESWNERIFQHRFDRHEPLVRRHVLLCTFLI